MFQKYYQSLNVRKLQKNSFKPWKSNKAKRNTSWTLFLNLDRKKQVRIHEQCELLLLKGNKKNKKIFFTFYLFRSFCIFSLCDKIFWIEVVDSSQTDRTQCLWSIDGLNALINLQLKVRLFHKKIKYEMFFLHVFLFIFHLNWSVCRVSGHTRKKKESTCRFKLCRHERPPPQTRRKQTSLCFLKV